VKGFHSTVEKKGGGKTSLYLSIRVKGGGKGGVYDTKLRVLRRG